MRYSKRSIRMITKNLNDISSRDFAAGEVILIDKSPGDSSFFAVSKIRRLIKIKKVGHAGTLDPFATGLLIICTGKMTKQISSFQNDYKIYEGVITLGKRTESFDTESNVIEEKPFDFVTEKLISETTEKFTGDIQQIPPMFSALKHKGKALYKYARKGIEIERPPREVHIYSFEINDVKLPDISFTVKCSKGTYIRSLADDFGKELGTVAYLTELRRTAIGEFNVNDALTLDEFENKFLE